VEYLTRTTFISQRLNSIYLEKDLIHDVIAFIAMFFLLTMVHESETLYIANLKFQQTVTRDGNRIWYDFPIQ
jgi:hypothetical protein